MRLADHSAAALRELAAGGATVLVPVGATEQHGPHLPIDTDTYLAEHFSLRCAEEVDGVLVAPAIPWGLSGNHVPLGGTITLRPTTYLELLLDVAKGLIDSGFEDQVWVNGHNGNKPTLSLLVQECQYRWGATIATVSYYDFGGQRYGEVRRSERGGEFHAGELETSLMQMLTPDRVGPTDGVGGLVEGLTEFDPVDVSGPFAAHIGVDYAARFPDGVAGDPTVASVETAAEVAEADLRGLIQFVGEYRDREGS
ncbi:MAG: creatininase family protein [Actinobacteria bacterium]|nr:creatininase family protein [Actinomycetota bacterium]